MKKFRAWDKKQKQMVTNFVIAPTSPGWSAFNFDSSLSDEIEKIYKNLCGDTLAWAGDYSVIDWGNWHGIEEYVIMQFTGLLDKHGNQVFEGDVLKLFHKYDQTEDIFHLSDFIGDTCCLRQFDKEDIEIVGNQVFENPDLCSESVVCDSVERCEGWERWAATIFSDIKDSVCFSFESGDSHLLYYRISSSAKVLGIRENKKFAIRSLDNGMRVWRIS